MGFLKNRLAWPQQQPRELPQGLQHRGDFLAKELVPAVREQLHATADPKQIIVGGASMGGLSAACAADLFRIPAGS